jgi:hypothetical protein
MIKFDAAKVYSLKVDTGEVDGGFVIIPLIYNMINCPVVTPVADNGFVYLIRYPVGS